MGPNRAGFTPVLAVDLWWIDRPGAGPCELTGGGPGACGWTSEFERLTGKGSTSGGGVVDAATRNWAGRDRDERGVIRPERVLVVRLCGICYQSGYL